MKKVLILNNDDSFVFNLAQIVHRLGMEYDVVQSAQAASVQTDDYHRIILSPGAGTPEQWPGMMQIIEQCRFSHPILGVCLGHQALAQFFGGKLQQLPHPFHGESCELALETPCSPILQGIPEGSIVGRYHSWIVAKEEFPETLQATAFDQEGRVMALQHRHLPLFGVQFHPESIISYPIGERIIANFCR